MHFLEKVTASTSLSFISVALCGVLSSCAPDQPSVDGSLSPIAEDSISRAVEDSLSPAIEGSPSKAAGSSVAAQQTTQIKTAEKRPNIIVVLADDMRAGYTGHEGHPIVQTPNIDSLAARGAVFSNSFATSTICQPSRTTLLTGQYERKHGINASSNSALSEESFRHTYPMLLKEAGYFVGYVGKNHTHIGNTDDGGFGYKSGVMESGFDYWYAGHGHLGFYPKDNPEHAIFKNAQFDTQLEIVEEGIANFFTADKAFSAGADFLQTRPDDQPFALLINVNVPHNGGTGSMAFRDSDLDLYKTTYRDRIDDIQLPTTYVAAKDIVEPKLPKHVYSGNYLFTYDYAKTPDTMRERDIRVMQTISGIDKLLGKMLSQLDEQGIANNTIVVFTSDHGIQHGEFGLAGKTLVYEPSIRIPLIIYDPRINKPVKNNDLVALVDVAPTLLDLAGLAIPDQMQGHSSKPLLNDEDVEWRQELFLENNMIIQDYPRLEAVRTHKWKYIRYFDKANDAHYAKNLFASINGEQPIYEELYDIENDPHEVNNVVSLKRNAATVDRLRQRVARMVVEYRGNEPLQTIPK